MKNDAENQAREFNVRFMVGQAVSLEFDDGTLEDTCLESTAWVIGGHSAIAKVRGHTDGWSVGRIHPRMT